MPHKPASYVSDMPTVSSRSSHSSLPVADAAMNDDSILVVHLIIIIIIVIVVFVVTT